MILFAHSKTSLLLCCLCGCGRENPDGTIPSAGENPGGTVSFGGSDIILDDLASDTNEMVNIEICT